MPVDTWQGSKWNAIIMLKVVFKIKKKEIRNNMMIICKVLHWRFPYYCYCWHVYLEENPCLDLVWFCHACTGTACMAVLCIHPWLIMKTHSNTAWMAIMATLDLRCWYTNLTHAQIVDLLLLPAAVGVPPCCIKRTGCVCMKFTFLTSTWTFLITPLPVYVGIVTWYIYIRPLGSNTPSTSLTYNKAIVGEIDKIDCKLQWGYRHALLEWSRFIWITI